MLQKSIILKKMLLSRNTHTKKGLLIVSTSGDHSTSIVLVTIKKHCVPRLQCNFWAGNFVVC